MPSCEFTIHKPPSLGNLDACDIAHARTRGTLWARSWLSRENLTAASLRTEVVIRVEDPGFGFEGAQPSGILPRHSYLSHHSALPHSKMKAGFLGGQRRSTRATRVRVRDAPAADDDDDDVPPPLVRDSDGSSDDDAASDDGPPSVVEFRGSGSDGDYSTVSGESPPPLVDDDEEFDSDADVSDPDESGDGRARARGARVNGPGAGSAASKSSKSIERDGSYYCTWKIPGIRQGMDNPTRQQYHTQYVDVGEMWDNLGGRWDDDTDKNNELAGLQPVQQRARLILYPSGDSASRRGWASCYLQMKQFQRVRTDGGDEWVEHNKGGMFFSNFAHYYVARTLRDDEIPVSGSYRPRATPTIDPTRTGGLTDGRTGAKRRSFACIDPDGALWVTQDNHTKREASSSPTIAAEASVGSAARLEAAGSRGIENMDLPLGMMSNTGDLA